MWITDGSMCDTILAQVLTEPGELTAKAIAADLMLDPKPIVKAAVRLLDRGMVTSTAWSSGRLTATGLGRVAFENKKVRR